MKYAAVILIVSLALLAGCAGRHYPEYAQGQGKAAEVAAQTDQQVLSTLGAALQSSNPGVQTAAAMGLAFWLAKHKPVELEQARPSPIEQGIGKAIPSIPMWGALYGMFSQTANNAGGTTNVSQDVSGNGAGGITIGSGTTTATTATAVPVEE